LAAFAHKVRGIGKASDFISEHRGASVSTGSNPLEDLAHQKPLRSGILSEKPMLAWFMGAQIADPRDSPAGRPAYVFSF
jgi:hypothetical protein